MAGPDVAAQVAAARAQHLAVLVDRVDVLRPTTATGTNPYDPRISALVKINTEPVPALVQATGNALDGSATPGPKDARLEPYIAKIPVSTADALGVRTGDWLLITASPLSPGLVGARIRVQRVQHSGVAVVARLHAVRSVPTRVRP